ncbi:hypothetical protein Bca52824_087817 [Brassica carinata]|uniref:Zinc knuckle CX2CX4HX4C domain-containing protein n=1 Tax=Brassica carinata TaxID=52824 RepID=A0A8X7TNN0_BRACI|nr:hypothetical protein Bca52824_087817 [Brassica carinata]
MELGQLDTYEVTRSADRVRVTIDGLKPLIKSLVLDFDSGEESIITMEYEKLGNHCSICNWLSHLRFQCPDRPMDLPTAPMSPPHGNSQSNDLHATRDYSTKTASSQRPNREPEFHQRLDRHGKPFGERISASLVSTRGPKNKLTPLLGKPEQYRKRPIDTEVET